MHLRSLCRIILTGVPVAMVIWYGTSVLFLPADEVTVKSPIDPAAWGSDHVGKPLPEYVTGDECLFCHRAIGPTWSENAHQTTIRPADPDDPAMVSLAKFGGREKLAKETRYLLGSKHGTRFLKRSKDYGKLEMLETLFVPKSGGGELRHVDAPMWDTKTFGSRCAGCHTTAVNTRSRAFSAVSLDCYACHGSVDLAHTKDVSLVLLSDKNREPRQVTSTCGQCHLRGGKSKSSGLPYPNTFVAGDNLFRDFQVDLSDKAIKQLPPIDQHIYLNSRDVAMFGRSAVTCLSCHDVHKQSSEKHQGLDNTSICSSCHVAGTDNSELLDTIHTSNRLKTHSRVCDY